jgi:hypothetical protein
MAKAGGGRMPLSSIRVGSRCIHTRSIKFDPDPHQNRADVRL